MSKPRIIKDFDKLETAIQEQIKLKYPLGFAKHLISFKNAKGEAVSALLFEAENAHYLVRMTIKKAQQIIRDDKDYDDAGVLKSDVKLDYSEKYKPDDLEEIEDMDEAENSE